MNELQLFNNPKFGEVRVTEIDGKIYFAGSDVAKALGYVNTRDAINRHCKGVVIHDVLTNGGIQEMNVITEGDIYRLAAKSQLPGAEEFESWIFDEVLPSIRKHGAYATDITLENMISDPDFAIQLFTSLKAEKVKRMVAEQERNEIKIELEEAAPKAEKFDNIMDSKNTLLTNQIAKEFGMSSITLNAILRNLKIQYKQNGQWLLYEKYQNKGYTSTKTRSGVSEETGESWSSDQTVWLQKGRLLIHETIRPLITSGRLAYKSGSWRLDGESVIKKQKKIKLNGRNQSIQMRPL